MLLTPKTAPDAGSDPDEGQEKTPDFSGVFRELTGGADGTRTRGLRRDRLPITTRKQTKALERGDVCGLGGDPQALSDANRRSSTNQFATPLLPNGRLRAVREPLLGVREVADLLGVSRATVYALVERAALPCVRVLNAIRVRPSDLSAFIASGGSRG